MTRALKTGDRVGRYVIVGPATLRGLRQIYKAFDPQQNRSVALELLPAGIPEMDAQPLPDFAHPNVVAMYDIGRHEHCVYLTTELVDGVDLRDWLTGHRSWKEIVEVFRAAGKGLAAAHSAGLLHRGLQPDAVVIARDGRVKLRDFALQKSIPSPAEPSRALIRNEAIDSERGGYLAPEVLRGEPGDARSDQFAFGVLLFESIHAELAARPGAPPAWADAVALRAIRSDPAERFESMGKLVGALSADPIARRRRYLAGAAVVAILGGITLGAVKNSAPECAPARRLLGVWDAPAQAALLQAFTDSGRGGAHDTADRVIHQLSGWAASWVAESMAACVPDHAAQRLCLERRRGEFRALATVLASADKSIVDEAVAASRRLTDPTRCREPQKLTAAPLPEKPGAVLETDALYARLDVARARLETGQLAAAIDAAKSLATDAERAHLDALQVEALSLLGLAQGRAALIPDATASLTQALAAARSQPDVFLAALCLARLHSQSGRFAEAEALAKRAEAALVALGDDDLLRADLLEARAETRERSGDLDGSIPLRQQTRELRQRLLGEGHPHTLAAATALAKALGDAGRAQEALALAQATLATLRLSVGKENPALISSHCRLCALQGALGDDAEARASCLEGARLAFTLRGEKSVEHGACLSTLSRIHSDAARGAEAVATADQALTIFTTVYGAEHLEVAAALLNRARGLLLLDVAGQPESDLRRALAIALKLLPPDDPRLADYLTTQGFILLAAKNPDEALSPLERALALRTRAAPAERADTRCALARALWESNRDRLRAVEQATLAKAELEGAPGLAGRRSAVEQWIAWTRR